MPSFEMPSYNTKNRKNDEELLNELFSNNDSSKSFLSEDILNSLQNQSDGGQKAVNMPAQVFSSQEPDAPLMEFDDTALQPPKPTPPPVQAQPPPPPQIKEQIPQEPSYQERTAPLNQLFDTYRQSALDAPGRSDALDGKARAIMDQKLQNQMTPEQIQALYKKAQLIRQLGTGSSEQSHKFFWYPQYGGTEDIAVHPEVIQRNADAEAQQALGPLSANRDYQQQMTDAMNSVKNVSDMDEKSLTNKAKSLQDYTNAEKTREGFETDAAKRDPNSAISKTYTQNVANELKAQADLMDRATKDSNRPYTSLPGFNRKLAEKVKGMSYAQAEGVLKTGGTAFDQIDKIAKDITNQEHNRATEALAGANLRARRDENNRDRGDKDASLNIDGFGILPGHKPDTEGHKKVSDAKAFYDSIRNNIHEIQDIVEKEGTSIQSWQGAGAKLASKYTTVVEALKDANNLGVLSGPDLGLLMKEVPDPNSIKANAVTRLNGPKEINSQYDGFLNSLGNKVAFLARSKGYDDQPFRKDYGVSKNSRDNTKNNNLARSERDQAAAKWLKDHPNSRFADEVRSHLGGE